MAFWFWIFCIFNCMICYCASKVMDTFTSPVKLTHLAVDSDTHTVYIGAVNTLYQLTEDLKLLQETKTGPVTDDKKCTPPITKESCPEAEETNNYVKLFVLDKPNNRIVVCGSVFKGICSLRKLQNISEILHYSTTEGEQCYVATNDENISTVGLVSIVSDRSLLFVAKGNGQHDNGIFVSTRLLDQSPNDKVPFEALSEYSVIKQEYTVTTPRFITVFEADEHIYFIVTRLDVIENRNKTFIARLCRDHPDYSYVDIALECDSETFNIAQSAYVANPGEELAQNMSDSGTYGTVTPQDKVLFVVFKKVDRGVTYEQSALCMFPLKQIDETIEVIRARAYGGNYQEGVVTVIYNPYGQNKDTGLRDDGSLQASNFPCGGDHLLFPIGSSLGVKVEPVKQYDKSLTAVAVGMENGHTVVFLGTSNGEIIKIFMRGAAEEYASIQLWNNYPVMGDLVFGAKQERLYVMTTYKITYIPVQTCEEFKDCQSCMLSRDPYCGWCVSEGKCNRKSECARAEEENHWLWSPNNSCIKITAANPEFLSIYTDSQEIH